MCVRTDIAGHTWYWYEHKPRYCIECLVEHDYWVHGGVSEYEDEDEE